MAYIIIAVSYTHLDVYKRQDTGCKIDGFNGDNACTFACGKVDKEAQRLMDVTKEALHRGIEAAQAGNRIGDIGHAVQSYVEENGFSVVRSFVGHGVGKELHEDPEVPNFGNPGRGPRLVPGMTIAIEPMVNQKACAVKTLSDGWTVKTCDGGLAAHFEHTIAITASGPEILTHEMCIRDSYKKILKRTVKFKAHDENNEAGVGDRVEIMETRKLSKDVNWRLVKIIEKAK